MRKGRRAPAVYFTRRQAGDQNGAGTGLLGRRGQSDPARPQFGPAAVLGGDLDINLDTPAPPSIGAALIQHIQAGVPYQMHINGAWKKVRLNWISPGRTFFIFTHGRQYKETVSVTSRMLVKMCETQRFRAFEQAQLLERATARARKQLAALNTR